MGRTFCDEAGTPVGFDGITIDVTARKNGGRGTRSAARE